MCAGLRRVGAADVPERHGGARRGAQQPEPARVPGDRRGQGRRGAELRAHRVVRGHRGVRGSRQHQPHGQRVLPGALGPPRRQRVPRLRRAQQPPAAHVHGAAAGGQIRQQDAHRRGDGHPLRRAHRRALLLHVLPQPHLQRNHAHRTTFFLLLFFILFRAS
jgi:hypothetical protein